MFGNSPGREEIDSLKQRVADLELALARQQQTIDLMASELGVDVPTPPVSLRREPGALHPEVAALLRQRKEIAAIKRHRELTGMGLRDAKMLIDREKGRYL